MTDWLPALMLMADYGGWDKYLEALYAGFREDFMETLPPFQERRLGLKRHPIENGKEATFWHMISEGRTEADRVPDLRRCERIRWPRQLIEETGRKDPRVRWWPNVRNRERRVVIALTDFTYAVVLADRGDYLLPWTAYVVHGWQREQFRKEWERSKH